MLLDVAGFEMRYLRRNPLLWVTAAGTFALFFIGVSRGLEMGSEGGLLENAAYATMRNALMTSLFFMLLTTAFVANAVIRDDETRFGPIIRSTRVGPFDYLFGRFLGAFSIAALCLALAPLGIWLGAAMPWADPATVGVNRLGDHLFAYFLIALPNLFIHSAIFFALATLTRSMMATYLGVVGFTSGYFTLLGAFRDRGDLRGILGLLEPFGSRALEDAVRYWTVAERNVALPEFAGTLLWNRVLWVGIAAGCLALAYARFRATEDGASMRERRRTKLAARELTSAADTEPAERQRRAAPRHDAAWLWTLLRARIRLEVKQVVRHPAFAVLMAWGMYVTGLVLLTQRDPDGMPTYPTTRSLIPEIDDPVSTILLVIAIYWAGELVWRERDRRVDVFVDATPMPNWAYVVPKTLAMAAVIVAVLLASVVAAVLLQLSLRFTDVELGKYLLWYVLPRAWDMLLIAALAVFVQAVVPHKAIAWAAMAGFVIWRQLQTSIDHNLLLFGGSPYVPLSDINGAGSFWIGAWIFRAYWGSFAVLLLVAAHLLWRRGTDVRLKQRLASARSRLSGAPAWVAGTAVLVLVATGAHAYHETVIVNHYRSPRASEKRMAAYERKYARYAALPQPRIVALTLDVALYPSARRALTKGSYRLRNETAEPIGELHLRVLGEDLELVSVATPGARLVSDDRDFGYRIYRLEQPMQPGEERVLAFETRLDARGYRNQPTFTRLVENGTFLSEAHLLPGVGLVRAGMLEDPATRRSYGLPEAPGVPRLEDLSATMNTTYGRGWASTDITVSTSADQTPVAPGSKVSDVVLGGRRVARFVSRVPIHPRFSIQSARYAEKHRLHDGIDLAVYYHPGHSWNVDRMLDAMTAALDYYRDNFGPYPFDHARIVEFPGFHDFAQAFAGTIPYSEDVGFVSDYRAPEAIDYVTYLTAHELSHQYWSHQVVGAEMEGREVLSETIAQYSAQMVMRKLRGPDHLRRYLRFELDRYLEGRAASAATEPPLARVNGQDFVTYRKGALAMYLLQERLGEAGVNRALRTLLERYRFKGAPYPRSLDLVAALRAEARTAEDTTLIADLFERVALYDLKITAPTAVRRPDGRWDVTVPLNARKVYVEDGAEREAPFAEHIEVGLFTAEPGRDAFDARDVIVLERRTIHSGTQVITFVTDRRPTYAGVDPYDYYVDRTPEDNVGPIH